MEVRKHFKFTGEVQGVGFRYRASHSAAYVGIKGWVRNEYDGSVEMEAQGTEDQINRVLELIKQGSYIVIDKMEVETIPLVDNEVGFTILH